MTNDNVLKVCAILTNNGIECKRTDKEVLIDRDSICNKISGKDENDSYDQLKDILNTSFGFRFNYFFKTDDWLMLDTLIR